MPVFYSLSKPMKEFNNSLDYHDGTAIAHIYPVHNFPNRST